MMINKWTTTKPFKYGALHANSMTNTYTQCRLRSDATEKTAWIPTRYARSGSVVEIGKRFQGRLWQVVSCGATLDADYVEEHERDYRTQREASDI